MERNPLARVRQMGELKSFSKPQLNISEEINIQAASRNININHVYSIILHSTKHTFLFELYSLSEQGVQREPVEGWRVE